MRLKVKFGVFIGLLISVIIIAVSGFLSYTESSFLVEQMQNSRTNMMKSFAQVTSEAIASNDIIPLRSYLELLKNTKGFTYASVTNNQNVIVTHTDTFLIGTEQTDEITKKAQKANDLLIQEYKTNIGMAVLDLALPVYINKLRVATVRIGFSKTMLASEVSDALSTTRKRIVFVTAAAIGLAIFATSLLIGFMLEPLNSMAKGAKLIGQGKLDQKIQLSSDDELGDLAKEFNKMSVKLQELDQLKSDFVSSVTHELRSPLLSLRLYIDMFIKGTAGAVNEKQQEYLNIMRDCSERLGIFIDDLLDVAKIERGKMEVTAQVINISPIIADTIGLFYPQFEKKSIKLTTSGTENAPLVKADADRTRQVLTNLLSNAVKFTPESKTINISVSIDNKSGYLEVSVSDTGIGIPQDQIDSIFNKFEQVKSAKATVEGRRGTGLGLAIVKGIIEAQKGTIRVSSKLNEGSTFTFTLPLASKTDA